jgi:hypothetical protein
LELLHIGNEDMLKDLGIVRVLVGKNVRIMYRNRSNQIIWFVSSILLFGALSLVFYLSKNETMHFSTSDPYQKLLFEVECKGNQNAQKSSFFCEAYHSNNEPPHSGTLTSSDLLVDFLSPHRTKSINDMRNGAKMMNTLASLMMNGLPLVGLDDFVFLSDYANAYLESNGMKQRILSVPELRDEFDNFLNVRSKVLRFSPDTPCTRRLVQYLNETSRMFAHLQIEIAKDMDHALDHCCDNVWAIVELSSTRSSTNSTQFEDDCRMLPVLKHSQSDPSLLTINKNKTIVDSAREQLVEMGIFEDPSAVDLPSVLIRMHPLATPDTRNIAWSPLKRSLSRQHSGQLLYFTSGFLSLQIEMQRFITFMQHEQNNTHLLRNRTSTHSSEFQRRFLNVSHHFQHFYDLLVASHQYSDGRAVTEFLRNFTSTVSNSELLVSFPMYHRAFPTHSFTRVSIVVFIFIALLLLFDCI